jgi:pyridinium-3,5-biscarboxylic acid mononucleotide sulfurtransferase
MGGFRTMTQRATTKRSVGSNADAGGRAAQLEPESSPSNVILPVDPATANTKLQELDQLLRALPSAVVAYSGGVDSAFLAYMAHRALGDRLLAVTADSPSLARADLNAAIEFAREVGFAHRIIPTSELDDERYARNGPDRCYFCKVALMDILEAIRNAGVADEILVGVNVDDLSDHRPGQAAVQKRGGRWPMVDVGLAKTEIRWLAHELGLSVWNKASGACLASRLAYGVRVTSSALERVESAEAALRHLPLKRQIRVRDQGSNLARIEVQLEDIATVVSAREEVVTALKLAGFRFITLDLEGYRQGSHNLTLGERDRHRPNAINGGRKA